MLSGSMQQRRRDLKVADGHPLPQVTVIDALLGRQRQHALSNASATKNEAATAADAMMPTVRLPSRLPTKR